MKDARLIGSFTYADAKIDIAKNFKLELVGSNDWRLVRSAKGVEERGTTFAYYYFYLLLVAATQSKYVVGMPIRVVTE